MNMRLSRHAVLIVLPQLFWAASALLAGPIVVPTAEGQIGETPEALDRIIGTRFESVRGQAGEILAGNLERRLSVLPGGGFEFEFLWDKIHAAPDLVPVVSETVTLNQAFELPPESAWSRNAMDNGDYVAFSYSTDGSAPGLIDINIRLFDQEGTQINAMTVSDRLVLPGFPDPFLSDTGVAVDSQGRVTVAYTELNAMNSARVKAQRFDGLTGLPIGGELPISDLGRASSDIALLDPAGNRLLIPTSDFATIRGNLLDLGGPTPSVLPEFPISTTPAAFGNFNQQVATDRVTGTAIVVWENNSGNVGDPVNVRARRFDAMGNPIGGDFRVNSTTANAQGQPDAAMGPGGLAAVVWAGDSTTPGDRLDVFLQVYGPDGQPIGAEVRANSAGEGIQDRPSVRFLPELDTQGRPQVAVLWRDIDNDNGTGARGTGKSYRCFSIEGIEIEEPIFADGFESGDTTSWSDQQP